MSGQEIPRQAAHRYAEAGWPVFPCRPGSKLPAIPAAHPEGGSSCAGECGRLGHGFHDATTDHALIDQWWRQEPGANVGIATGAPGPDVLDIDVKKDRSGYAALREARQAGLVPRPAAAIRTPSGGAHLYFRGTEQRNGALPARALDFRGRGGYVVAPPSFSAEHGRRYEVISHQAADAALDWGAVRELLDPRPGRPTVARPAGDRSGMIVRLATWLETRPEGNRNFPLFFAAKTAALAGFLDADTRERLIDASLRSGLRGGEREARRTVASGERAAQHDGRRGMPDGNRHMDGSPRDLPCVPAVRDMEAGR